MGQMKGGRGANTYCIKQIENDEKCMTPVPPSSPHVEHREKKSSQSTAILCILENRKLKKNEEDTKVSDNHACFL
jgi:hypothetical protein